HRQAPEASTVQAEFLVKARSSRYAAAIENASSNAYCRTSLEPATEDGRNKTRTNPIQATVSENTMASQRNVIQQKTIPAMIEGTRSANSEVPTGRQACNRKLNN